MYVQPTTDSDVVSQDDLIMNLYVLYIGVCWIFDLHAINLPGLQFRQESADGIAVRDIALSLETLHRPLHAWQKHGYNYYKLTGLYTFLTKLYI